MPINLGFSAKGNTSDASGMYEAILAGASGFKLHEDWGTTPSSIDTCLAFADEHDVGHVLGSYLVGDRGGQVAAYDALLDDPQIEAVYICLPTALRKPYVPRRGS